MKRDTVILLALLVLLLLTGGGIFVYERFKSRKDFLDRIHPDAKRLQALTGIDPLVTLTQAAHESNFGNSELSAKYHNLFGIKAGSSWKGPTADLLTHEEVGGKQIPMRDRFRAYPSFYESLQDWAAFLATRYPQAYDAAKRGDLAGFGEGLKHGKYGAYATDSQYASKILSIGRIVEGVA